MTERKPDFYVLKRAGLDGVPEWFTYDTDGHVWDYQHTLRHRFVTQTDAAGVAKKYGGSIVPVFCTTRKAEPKMRERSSSWVLKRLAEGKVVLALDLFHRFDAQEGIIENFVQGKWLQDVHGFCTSGRVLCRIAKTEEVPT